MKSGRSYGSACRMQQREDTVLVYALSGLVEAEEEEEEEEEGPVSGAGGGVAAAEGAVGCIAWSLAAARVKAEAGAEPGAGAGVACAVAAFLRFFSLRPKEEKGRVREGDG